MLYSETDPESYITEYTLVYEEKCPPKVTPESQLRNSMPKFNSKSQLQKSTGVPGGKCKRVHGEDISGHGCEDRVLDGPASGEKGSKGGPYKYCNPRT